MSSLSKFLGKPKVIKIKDQEITIHPLKVKDLDLIDFERANPEQKMKMTVSLVKKSLKDPDVTDQEIEDMDLEIFAQLMEEITKLNGLEDERARKIKESIARRSTN